MMSVYVYIKSAKRFVYIMLVHMTVCKQGWEKIFAKCLLII